MYEAKCTDAPCRYVRSKRARRDRSRAVLRCIPRTFNAFLRDLMHACICYSECDEGRTRALHIARRKTSLFEIVASRYSLSLGGTCKTLYKLDEFFRSNVARTPLEYAFQSFFYIPKRDKTKSDCVNSTFNLFLSKYQFFFPSKRIF